MAKVLYKQWFTLTVAESKRLIAQGLKRYAPVAKKLKDGTVVITKGTTGKYIAEEFLGIAIANGDYVYGHLLPAQKGIKLDKQQSISEVVLKQGKMLIDAYPDVLNDMLEGDIIFKGANLINYKRQQAGVMIIHPQGGTSGLIIPAIEKYKLHLIIPVGLEKDCSEDIDALSAQSKKLAKEADGATPWLWSIKGELFTEIEALKQWADVEIELLGKGGIGGAEGAVTFCVSGEKDEVTKAINVVKTIQGEDSYVK